MKDLFISQVLQANRLIKYEYNQVCKRFGNNTLIHQVTEGFLTDYANFFELSPEEVANQYLEFLTDYSKDLSVFNQIGKYPHENGDIREVARTKYDLALILSILCSPIRYQIINLLISQTSSLTASVAVIGIGSGIDLEMLLVSLKPTSIIAYDISLSDFTKSHFENKVELKEVAFEHESSCDYDAVIAIELLEHLPDPYKLIKEVADSLNSGGHFIFTTATNMPQFDHLYNFTDDDHLANYLEKVGLRIAFKEELFHHYMKEQAPSKNTFYVTTKF